MTLASASGFCGPNDLEGKSLKVPTEGIKPRLLTMRAAGVTAAQLSCTRP